MLAEIMWHAMSVERMEANAGKTKQRAEEREMVINGVGVRTKRAEEGGRSCIKS